MSKDPKTWVDQDGTRYRKAKVTVLIPLDLIEFWREHTGTSEATALKRIKSEFIHTMGSALTSLGVVAWDDGEMGLAGMEENYEGIREGVYGRPGEFWSDADGEPHDLQMGQVHFVV